MRTTRIILPVTLLMIGVSALLNAAPPSEPRAIPYQGRLEQGGAPVDGVRALRFRFFDAPEAGTALGAPIDRAVSVVGGAFATVLSPVPIQVFDGSGVWIAIEVEGVALAGRQEVLSVPFALGTVGGEDLAVSGDLTVEGGAFVGGGLDVGGALDVGAGLDLTGALRLGGNNAVLTGLPSGEIRARASGTGLVVQADGDVAVEGALDLAAIANGCPSDMDRAGIWCVDKQMRGPSAWTTAVSTCQSAGLGLCPLEALLTCDQLNTNNATANSCGNATDGTVARIHTATTANPYYYYAGTVEQHNGFGTSVFESLVCYDPGGSGGELNNSIDECTSDSVEAYFCCIGATAVERIP